jgi:DNA repair exonuclease SbcCD ATPase subunit
MRKAEDEIREWRDQHEWRYLDLNLVLFVPDRPTAEVISGIRHDTTLCRKFVVTAQDPVDARLQLSCLPFSPLDTKASASLRVLGLQPERLLRRSGASDEFARDLVAHIPGTKALADKALLDEYALVATGATDEADTSRQEASDQSHGPYVVSIDEVALRNFRGIGDEVKLPLGRNVTIFYGINGTGKTSICDAIEWAVAGSVSRIASRDNDAREQEAERSIINYFKKAGEAYVQLALSGDVRHYVRRSVDDDLSQHVTSSAGSNDWAAILATTQSERRPGLDLRRAREAFRSCHVLPQSTIREFLEKDPLERFEALSRILGYEEVIRLSRKLEGVRELVAEEVRKREAARLEVRAQVQEEQVRVDSMIEAIAARQSGQDTQRPSSQMIVQLKADLREVDVPASPLSEDATPDTAMEWLVGTIEALSAMQVSLSAGSNKVGEVLQASKQVEPEAQEAKSLADSLKAADAEQRAITSRLLELETLLAGINLDQERATAQLAGWRAEENGLRWTASNGPILKQEEERLRSVQKELQIADKEAHDRHSVMGELQERIEALANQAVSEQVKVRDLEARRAAVQELVAARHEWERIIASLMRLNSEARQLEERTSQEERGISAARENHSKFVDAISILQERHDEQKAINTRRSQLVAELRQLLAPSERICPFCGSEYKDYIDLVAHVERGGHTPSGDYQQTLSQIQEADGNRLTLEREIASREETLMRSREEYQRIVERANSERRGLQDLRNKAAQMGLLPSGAIDDYVPSEAELQSAIDDLRVPEAQRLAQSIASQRESASSAMQRMLDVEKEALTRRASMMTLISQAEEHIQSLRSTASGQAAEGLLDLTKSELTAKITDVAASISRAADSVKTLEESALKAAQERSAILEQRNALQRQVDEWRRRAADIARRESDLRVSARNLGIDGVISPERIEEYQRKLEERAAKVARLLERCTLVKDVLQADGLQLRANEAMQSLDRQKTILSDADRGIRDIKVRLSAIEGVAKALQENTVADMSGTLKALTGPLNSVFERLNGHPLFGALRIEPDEKAKTVTFRVETSAAQNESPSDIPPRSYLSDAQLNIVALSVFLSIALYQTWSKCKIIVIDDPVQQMDDLNAASFIDLIRQLSVYHGRQFVITTCNNQFYRLALSKLSCLNAAKSNHFRAYRLLGIRPQGPEIVVDAPYWENENMRSERPGANGARGSIGDS